MFTSKPNACSLKASGVTKTLACEATGGI